MCIDCLATITAIHTNLRSNPKKKGLASHSVYYSSKDNWPTTIIATRVSRVLSFARPSHLRYCPLRIPSALVRMTTFLIPVIFFCSYLIFFVKTHFLFDSNNALSSLCPPHLPATTFHLLACNPHWDSIQDLVQRSLRLFHFPKWEILVVSYSPRGIPEESTVELYPPPMHSKREEKGLIYLSFSPTK